MKQQRTPATESQRESLINKILAIRNPYKILEKQNLGPNRCETMKIFDKGAKKTQKNKKEGIWEQMSLFPTVSNGPFVFTLAHFFSRWGGR